MSVRGIDKAGNTGSFSTITFKVDRTAPVINNLAGPNGWITSAQIKFNWGVTEAHSGLDYFEYKIDSGSVARGASPLTINTPADGTHTLSVR